MELYLDSANEEEIKKASQLGYIYGLTTTPTFMVREGVKDIDAQILKIAEYVNVIQIEALGDSAEEIVEEANRLIGIGLKPETTVFKIPVSLEGTRACKMLIDQGLQVNLHLVYTIQQAYMAFSAGATYVCPLVGRLQDQGHDALGLVQQCVDITHKYNYNSKIMFSSVRNIEHVKNALNIGVQTITIPWKVMSKLCDNHFTAIGTNQFIEDTRILTNSVGEIAKTENVTISSSKKISDALLVMTESKLGALVVLNEDNNIHRVLTDADIRRMINEKGENLLSMTLNELPAQSPKTIDSSVTLFDARKVFNETKVDTLVAMDGESFAGLVDIQQVI